MTTHNISRRTFAKTLTAGLALPFLAKRASADNAAPSEIRIGYQKNGVLLIAKAQGLLEKRFGASVKWVEFQFGPPLLEALNAGAIDYGTTGDAPPIFAQIAKANLLYVAALPERGANQSIIVKKDSPLKTVQDLKGKKVGIAKASSAHNLAIAALESVGLSFTDIEPQYLAPADAAAAFSRGSIDAWSIWDPYLAIAELNQGARQLPISEVAAAQNTFFLANKSFTEKYPETVAGINDVLATASQWADKNHEAAAQLFSEASGVDIAAQKLTVSRSEFSFVPLDEKIVTQQQAVADRFAKLGLIPHDIAVKDIVWTWKPAA